MPAGDQFIRGECIGRYSRIPDHPVPEIPVDIVRQTGPGKHQSQSCDQTHPDEKDEVMVIFHLFEQYQKQTECCRVKQEEDRDIRAGYRISYGP